MLRAVGHPVAVNPDPALAEIAGEEGWEMMRFERLGRRLVAVVVTLLATSGRLRGVADRGPSQGAAAPVPGAALASATRDDEGEALRFRAVAGEVLGDRGRPISARPEPFAADPPSERHLR